MFQYHYIVLARDSIYLARYYAIARLSVCLSRGWIGLSVSVANIDNENISGQWSMTAHLSLTWLGFTWWRRVQVYYRVYNQ